MGDTPKVTSDLISKMILSRLTSTEVEAKELPAFLAGITDIDDFVDTSKTYEVVFKTIEAWQSVQRMKEDFADEFNLCDD